MRLPRKLDLELYAILIALSLGVILVITGHLTWTMYEPASFRRMSLQDSAISQHGLLSIGAGVTMLLAGLGLLNRRRKRSAAATKADFPEL